MNAPKGTLVDHQNSDKLDNRRANLRLATNSQNQCNRRKTKNTSSQYKGVCLCPEKTHWYANIKHKGKKIWLGSFTSEIEAALAYDKAALEYHREFARLNFPQDKAGACPP
ncbi:MAG: AP2/ERF family transcription factor [Sedimentisphaerales bacterium]